MKKIFMIIAVTFCIVFTGAANSVYAMPGDTVADENIWRVYQQSEYLTTEEQNELNEMAVSIADSYGIDVVVWIVDDCEGKSHMDYADDAFDYEGYGYGENHDGVMLLICMDPDCRGMWISTCGGAYDLYYNRDMDIIEGYLIDDLRAGAYAEAVRLYLNLTDTFLYDGLYEGGHVWSQEEIDRYTSGSDYQSGNPDDDYGEDVNYVVMIIWAVLSLACGIGLACLFIYGMRSEMRTGVIAGEAGEYLVSGTFKVRDRRDKFLYSNVSKTKRESSSGGGGGGHGGHISSSGRSHGGGGRSF